MRRRDCVRASRLKYCPHVKVAFGFKAHSGWAALVALGGRDSDLEVVDRRRIELVEAGDADWARQPYHAAEHRRPAEAREMAKRGVDSARSSAIREVRAAARRAREAGHDVAACAVLVGGPMPSWSVDQILAVHFRMHQAEGILFRNALLNAAAACELPPVEIPEKRLAEDAKSALGRRFDAVLARIAALGRSVGPPWGRDQREAALAAAVALLGRARGN